MGRIFTVELQIDPKETSNYYCCRGCYEDNGHRASNLTHIALHDDLAYKGTVGLDGRPSSVFSKVVNVTTGEPNNRIALGHRCKMADLYCVRCRRSIGSKFVEMSEESTNANDLVTDTPFMLEGTKIDRWEGNRRLQPIVYPGEYHVCP